MHKANKHHKAQSTKSDTWSITTLEVDDICNELKESLNIKTNEHTSIRPKMQMRKCYGDTLHVFCPTRHLPFLLKWRKYVDLCIVLLLSYALLWSPYGFHPVVSSSFFFLFYFLA